MRELETTSKSKLPPGVTLDSLPFIPRMVMTAELQAVARQVLDQWRMRDKFKPLAKYGIRPLDRLLFFGPPGNGKTMACYWMAKELGVPVYRIMCNQLHGMYLGQTTSAVADVLEFLNKMTAPALCLWDEVEAIFIDRAQAGGSGASREIATATTIFLQALDRWSAPTLLVLATNLPDKLDAALLSRVEMRVRFPEPTADQCGQAVQYWRELLHDHGGGDWGPEIEARLESGPAESFRELQQWVAAAARDWTAKRFAGAKR